MNNKYIVKDFPHCLGHVIEECGEVLAAAGKTLRWGEDGYNPELHAARRERNAVWLWRELKDLEGAIKRLQWVMLHARLTDDDCTDLRQMTQEEALLEALAPRDGGDDDAE